MTEEQYLSRSSGRGSSIESPHLAQNFPLAQDSFDRMPWLLFVGTENEYNVFQYYNQHIPVPFSPVSKYAKVLKLIINSIDYIYEAQKIYKNMDIIVDPNGKLINTARKILKNPGGIYITSKETETRPLEPFMRVVIDTGYDYDYKIYEITKSELGRPFTPPQRILTKSTLFKIVSVLGIGAIAGVIAGVVSSKK